jgi:hypothetical protein
VKFIDDMRKKFNEGDDDDKLAYIGGAVLLLFVSLLALLLMVVIVKEILPYALVGVVLYAIGVWKLGFPIPKFVKKFIK